MNLVNEDVTDWDLRPSQHEMLVSAAIDLSYEVANQKRISSQNMHSIVTKAIASMPAVAGKSNIELLQILFGYKVYVEKNSERFDSTRVDINPKRLVRHFRNSERSLKLSTASAHIVSLLHAKVIEPFEAGRLLYISFVFSAAINLVNKWIKENDLMGSEIPPLQKNDLLSEACASFEKLLIDRRMKLEAMAVNKWPEDDTQLLITRCAHVYWAESNMKRNPGVSLRRIWDLAKKFNKYEFDDYEWPAISV